MTSQVPGQVPGNETPPVARLISSDEVPTGFWSRDYHFPLPVTPLYADFKIGKHLPLGQKAAIDEFALLTTPAELLIIDGYVYGGSSKAPEPPSAERVGAFEEKVRNHHEWVVLRRWREGLRSGIINKLLGLLELDLRTLTDAELLSHIRQLCDYSTYLSAVHYTNARAARFVIGRCALFCTEQLGLQDTEFWQLLAGFSSASSDPVTRLDELAEDARRDPTLLAALEAPEPWADPALRALLQRYLEMYGHRGVEFEYAAPTLAEQPHRAIQLLREAVARLATGMERGADKVRSQRQATVEALRHRLPNQTARAEFDRLLHDAQDVYGVRDDDIGLCLWGNGLMRYALLEAGLRLAERGLLMEREKVWYLRRPELEEALSGRPDVRLSQQAEARRSEHQRQRQLEPPGSLGTPFAPAAPVPPLSDEAQRALRALEWRADQGGPPVRAPTGAVAQELRGRGASPGVYTGPARVVLWEDQFDRVRPGDVLVCIITSPTWNILFGKIGALVTDEGGILSHPAIIAREFGIPCVVATRTATKAIADGQMVHVDGTSGVVRLS